jgi:hypothetical protein
MSPSFKLDSQFRKIRTKGMELRQLPRRARGVIRYDDVSVSGLPKTPRMMVTGSPAASPLSGEADQRCSVPGLRLMT